MNGWVTLQHSTGLHARCVAAIGGHDGRNPLSTVAIFDIAQSQWSNGAAPMRVERSHHAAASLGGAIYVLGGNRADARKTAERYDMDANRWTAMTFDHNGPAAASLGDRVLVMGGDRTTTVEVYDPSTDRWVRGPALPVGGLLSKGCKGPAAVSIGNAVYVMGGADGKSRSLDCLHRLDPRARKWQPLTPMPSKRHCLTAATTDENTIFAIGGSVGTQLSTVERFDVRAGRWAEAHPMRVGGAGLAAVAMDGNQIMALGGYDSDRHVSTVELYDAHTDTWRDGPPPPQAYNARCDLAAVVL